jgi:hypothetical protein
MRAGTRRTKRTQVKIGFTEKALMVRLRVGIDAACHFTSSKLLPAFAVEVESRSEALFGLCNSLNVCHIDSRMEIIGKPPEAVPLRPGSEPPAAFAVHGRTRPPPWLRAF